MHERNEILQEVENKASEELGVRHWDRPGIYRESAEAATDGDLPYWMVLLLSGGIATLGLALDSSAVVIGAMLIAPLLAPVLGLALGLAVGDGRLTFQTALMVVVSTAGVIGFAALLTVLLPFQTVTAEISARTRPTTLDLVIAVFSGLAGAVVTVARGHRLSAAIPGVAISVALIPPLAVAGFGIGMGWNWSLIHGSLLLYGANLAGIVLSGMGVFLLIGMHREQVLETAREWHRDEHATGLVAWANGFRWVRSLGLIHSTGARMALVLGFVVAVAVPLSRTLQEIARESRVHTAVSDAEAIFDQPGRSSILSERVVMGDSETRVYLRVATAEWFDEESRAEFNRRASEAAGEPVDVILEQLPASTGDLEKLAALLPSRTSGSGLPVVSPEPSDVPGLLAALRLRLERAAGAMVLPDDVEVAGVDVRVGSDGAGSLSLVYTAENPLPPEAVQVIGRQLARAVADSTMGVELVHVSARSQAADSARLSEAAVLLRRYPGLRAELVAGPGAARAAGDAAERLAMAGVPRNRIATAADGDGAPRIRLVAGGPRAVPADSSTVPATPPGVPRP